MAAGAKRAAATSVTKRRRSRLRLCMVSALSLDAGLFGGSDAGRLDDRPPQRDLRLELRGKRFRRRSDDEDAQLLEPGLDQGLLERGDRVGIDLLYDVGRRLGRYEERVPRRYVE